MRNSYLSSRSVWLFGALFIALIACTSKVEPKKSVESFKLKGKKAMAYTTAKNTGQRLSKNALEAFTDLDQPDEMTPTIMVDPNKKFQEILGIGGALTDASAETFYQLPEKLQQEIMEAYFNPDEGIGYTLCRIPIHSCDFSSESYRYTEVANDTLLEHFSIEHDRQFKLPFIKAAMNESKDEMQFFASPWSPPAWMKTNNNMLQGGKLKPEFYASWANYFVKFIDAYQQEGIPIWGVTVQNEPMRVGRIEEHKEGMGLYYHRIKNLAVL